MNAPLAGKRIVITRAESQSAEFADMIREAGAIPILFPTIQIEPIPNNVELDSALQHLDQYDWVVFTSANGVRLVLDRMEQLGVPVTALNNYHIAVIGPGTGILLRERKIRIDLLPDEYVAEAIVQVLLTKKMVTGKRFLLLRADIARPTLREQLIEQGAIVSEVPVYHTIKGNPTPEAYAALRAGVDMITFTSSSTVRFFFELLGDEAKSVAHKANIICIGPITEKTARDMGLNVLITSQEYDIKGLMETIQFAVGRQRQ